MLRAPHVPFRLLVAQARWRIGRAAACAPVSRVGRRPDPLALPEAAISSTARRVRREAEGGGELRPVARLPLSASWNSAARLGPCAAAGSNDLAQELGSATAS